MESQALKKEDSIGVETISRLSSIRIQTSSPSSAAVANHAEHSMTLHEGIRLYPRAIMWSVLLSSCLIMEGFDTALLPNFFAYEPFKQHFGEKRPDGTHELTAGWQTALSNGSLSGQVVGLFTAGVIAEGIGYRKTLIGALTAAIGLIFVVFFAQTKATLLVGQMLLGVPYGIFQALTTIYAAEVCPVALRAYLTTYVNACWVFGQLLASAVFRVMATRTDNWGYRIPFACQWFWPIPVATAVYLAPESPWWLVRNNRYEEAHQVLRRLKCKTEDVDEVEYEQGIMGALEVMKQTDEREKAIQCGTSFLDCLKGVDLRRTEIACACWVIQTLCGSTFMAYSTYFYQQAGVPTHHAFTFSVVQYGLGLLGVGLSWILMTRAGRRTLYLYGQALMLIFLFGIGILSLIPTNSATKPDPITTPPPDDAAVNAPTASNSLYWLMVAFLLLFVLTYDATVGPICYALVSEMPSTRLRAKTIIIARCAYTISGITTNSITPRMLNPTAWAWGPKSAFFWCGTAFISIVWSYARLPEPKGRTYAELDELFEKRVEARKFKSVKVEVFKNQSAVCDEAVTTAV